MKGLTSRQTNLYADAAFGAPLHQRLKTWAILDRARDGLVLQNADVVYWNFQACQFLLNGTLLNFTAFRPLHVRAVPGVDDYPFVRYVLWHVDLARMRGLEASAVIGPVCQRSCP